MSEEISIVTPGGYVVLRKFWMSRRRGWIGTIVANWRTFAVGVEWLGNGVLIVVGPLMFAVAAVLREPRP